MKKLTTLFLSLALLLVLCACGAPNASSGNASSGDAYASWGNASAGDAYASWGNASAGDAYASSGNAAGVLPLSATPASTDEPFFCVTLESSRLYAFPAGGGEGRLLVDKYTNCFDQDGDSVLASFDDGSVRRFYLPARSYSTASMPIPAASSANITVSANRSSISVKTAKSRWRSSRGSISATSVCPAMF